MTLGVGGLRCEYRENPIGIGVPKPRISWKLTSEARNVLQAAYQIQVAKEDHTFSDLVWDTGRVSSDRSIQIEYDGGTLESGLRYYYRVRVEDSRGNASDWSETAFWQMGLLNRKEWIADWITSDTEEDVKKSGTCSMLRRSFEIRGKVKKATVYATSLGLYQLQINGRNVTHCLFAPGWTSYKKRIQYQTYDVTHKLAEGRNAIGALLGSGWYKGNLTWNNTHNFFGDKKALFFQMHILYEDGRQEVLCSDSRWKAASGPLCLSEIYHGESYDARLEKDGWSEGDYDDSQWEGVNLLAHTRDILVAQESVPVKRIEEIAPKSIFTTPRGETVIDFGQNMVGWVRFTVTGVAGSKVVLKHAEVLDKDGNFYTANLRKAQQTVKYRTRGNGVECFEPHFTFQGFRYVKVEEYPGTPSLDHFVGVVIHSDMEKTGSFRCSDPLVNQLQHNILWGQKGNFLDVPTDCPQRDERLGWTGDAQVFIRTACFNMEVVSFFTKWLRDLTADQLDDGSVPFVVPHVLKTSAYSSAAWGDAAVIVPWTLYLCYGDTRILEEQYGSMKAWVEYQRRQGSNEYLWNTGFHFGDWLSLNTKTGNGAGTTDTGLIATAFYAYSTQLLFKTAQILGYTEEASRYEELHKKIAENFRKEFVTPNGRLVSSTQTAYVLALMFDLLEDRDKNRAIEMLEGYIREKELKEGTGDPEENGCYLTTGFVGTPYLCQVLSENGRHDIAFKLLMQKGYPSWLYQVTKGATTIWERWDGIKEDGSFQKEQMNSFNHYAYGAIGNWLYTKVCGIDVDERQAGYKHIHIRPMPGKELDFAEAELETLYGRIRSGWERKQDTMIVKIEIPPNTTARVVLPGAAMESLREKDALAGMLTDFTGGEQLPQGVALNLGSGSYTFEYTE